MGSIKLTTVNIKEMSREDLEQAYKRLLKISLAKTDLIRFLQEHDKTMGRDLLEITGQAGQDIKELADSVIKSLPAYGNSD